MTWGETAKRKLGFNGQHEKKVAARALTSIELFAVSLYFDAQREQHASFNLFEHCAANFAQPFRKSGFVKNS